MRLLGLITAFLFIPIIGYTATVDLVWDPPDTSETVMGYRIYYGKWIIPAENCQFSDEQLTEILGVGDTTSCTVTELEAGQWYFFRCTAIYSSGVESAFSNGVYTYIPKPPPPRKFHQSGTIR